MSKIHPQLETLVDFAAGTLSYHETVMISTHISYCNNCRQQVMALECLGGELMNDLPGEPVSDALLQQSLAAISDEAHPRPDPADLPQASPGIPRPLQRLIRSGYDSLQWRSVLPNVQVCDLDQSPSGETISLYRIKPGASIPMHTHRGNEYTVILQGGFSDDLGQYVIGDFLHRAGQHEHQPVADAGEDCICLTVTEQPLKMTSWKWRWINPFLGT
jgi:putative transcriptional regulator